MDEGWHVAEMILTVQVAEKRKLCGSHHVRNPRPAGPLCYTPTQRRHPWQWPFHPAGSALGDSKLTCALASWTSRASRSSFMISTFKSWPRWWNIRASWCPGNTFTRSYGLPTHLSISMSALILRSKDCATHWAIQRRNPATSRPCRGAATASSPLWRTAQNKGHLRHRVLPNPPQTCTPLWKPWTPQGPPHRRRPPPALVEPGLVGRYPDWEFWWCCSLRPCALLTPPRFRPPALGSMPRPLRRLNPQ